VDEVAWECIGKRHLRQKGVYESETSYIKIFITLVTFYGTMNHKSIIVLYFWKSLLMGSTHMGPYIHNLPS
jgi:hypothetical protein